MRIQRVEHARNRAFEHDLIRLHLVGEVRLHRFVNLREFLDAGVDFGFGLSQKRMNGCASNSKNGEPQPPARNKHS